MRALLFAILHARRLIKDPPDLGKQQHSFHWAHILALCSAGPHPPEQRTWKELARARISNRLGKMWSKWHFKLGDRVFFSPDICDLIGRFLRDHCGGERGVVKYLDIQRQICRGDRRTEANWVEQSNENHLYLQKAGIQWHHSHLLNVLLQIRERICMFQRACVPQFNILSIYNNPPIVFGSNLSIS